MAIGQDLLNVPMGDMIRQMAFAIADAQLQLDESSLRVAEMMSGERVERNENGLPTGTVTDTRVSFDGEQLSMIELGFTPTFYQFIDTIIEVKIAIKITRSSEYKHARSDTARTKTDTSSTPGPLAGIFAKRRNSRTSETVTTSQVDASYAAKYSYSAEGASLLRTKLTPIPPPAILEERIRGVMEQETQRRTKKLEDAAAALATP